MLLLGHAGAAAGMLILVWAGRQFIGWTALGERRPVQGPDPARKWLDSVREVFEDFPGGVTFQAAHDLSDRFAFGGSSLHVAFGFRIG